MCFSFYKLRGNILNGQAITKEEEEIEDANLICWNVNISPDIAILDRPYSAEIQARMDSICKAHGDITFTDPYIAYPISNYKSFALNIVSDKDFDAAHPAGTSLNDIVNIRFSSAETFIKSGYKDYGITSDLQYGSDNIYYQTESVPQFNAEKRKMIAMGFYLSFSSAPDADAVHNLTVSYTLETGRTVSNTIEGLTIKK